MIDRYYGWLVGCCIACFIAFLLGMVVNARWSPSMAAEPDAAVQAAQCRQAWAAASAPTDRRETTQESAREGCFRQVQSDLLLREIQFRRSRFIQQSTEGGALLVTVVFITFSGVALSAVQFLASYRLANAGKGAMDQASEMSIERDRITLKSSVIGLFVLACSLAFFILFVVHVHPIREVGAAEKVSASAPRQLEAGDVVHGSAPLSGPR